MDWTAVMQPSGHVAFMVLQAPRKELLRQLVSGQLTDYRWQPIIETLVQDTCQLPTWGAPCSGAAPPACGTGGRACPRELRGRAR